MVFGTLVDFLSCCSDEVLGGGINLNLDLSRTFDASPVEPPARSVADEPSGLITRAAVGDGEDNMKAFGFI